MPAGPRSAQVKPAIKSKSVSTQGGGPPNPGDLGSLLVKMAEGVTPEAVDELARTVKFKLQAEAGNRRAIMASRPTPDGGRETLFAGADPEGYVAVADERHVTVNGSLDGETTVEMGPWNGPSTTYTRKLTGKNKPISKVIAEVAKNATVTPGSAAFMLRAHAQMFNCTAESYTDRALLRAALGLGLVSSTTSYRREIDSMGNSTYVLETADSAADESALLGRAADYQSLGWNNLPALHQGQLPPGCYACGKLALPPHPGKGKKIDPRMEDVVWAVPGGLPDVTTTIEPVGMLRALHLPHYWFLEKRPEAIQGMPSAVMVVATQETPGARPVMVVSCRSGATKQIYIVPPAKSGYILRGEAVQALAQCVLSGQTGAHFTHTTCNWAATAQQLQRQSLERAAREAQAENPVIKYCNTGEAEPSEVGSVGN